MVPIDLSRATKRHIRHTNDQELIDQRFSSQKFSSQNFLHICDLIDQFLIICVPYVPFCGLPLFYCVRKLYVITPETFTG